MKRDKGHGYYSGRYLAIILPTWGGEGGGGMVLTLRVQVPDYHILSKIVTYITTILNPST